MASKPALLSETTKDRYIIMSPEGGTYIVFVCVPARREASAAHLSDHLKKKLFRYLHNFFFYMSMVSIAWLVLIFSNF